MSKNVEYLNLDEVAPRVQKVLKIKGESYEFKLPSVGEFVEEMQRAKALQKKFQGIKDEDIDELEIMQAMVDSLQRSVKNAFPDIPKEVLDSLNRDQLNAIKAFIEQEFTEENAAAEDELGNEPAAKKAASKP
jgi:methyltransferase-like protein